MTAEAGRALVGALTGLFPGAECDFGIRPGKVGDDARLLERLLAYGRPARRLRLWDNAPCLVVSRRIEKMARFGEARRFARRAGWPVAVRASGGTTVVHRPGVLNLSLVTVDRGGGGTAGGFDRLCELIVGAGQAIGVALEAGEVARGYCAGSHDIGWRGRKIAGTAAIARRRDGWHGRVVHASLVVEGDAAADVAAISAFERALGMPGAYDPAAHCSLADALSAQAEPWASTARSCFGEQPNFAL